MANPKVPILEHARAQHALSRKGWTQIKTSELQTLMDAAQLCAEMAEHLDELYEHGDAAYNSGLAQSFIQRAKEIGVME